MSLNQLRTNIKFLRKRKKLSQQSASDVMGINISMWGSWEEQRAIPQTKELQSLSQLFGITINDLVTEDMTKVEMYNKEWYELTAKQINHEHRSKAT